MSAIAFRLLDGGDGPWVVWVHGFLGSSLDFLPFARRLAPRFRSLLVDLPAHGDSAHVEPESVSASARLVGEAMDINGIDRAVVAGYSLGGRVALDLAERHADRTAGLILESASPGIIGAEARARRIRMDETRAGTLLDQSREDFLSNWYRQSVFRSLATRPSARQTLIATRRIPDPKAMGRALALFSPGRQTPNWSALPRLTCPILCVAGRLDGKYLAVSRRIADVSRRAALAQVRDSGHVVHFEAPEAYFEAVVSFLKQQSPRG